MPYCPTLTSLLLECLTSQSSQIPSPTSQVLSYMPARGFSPPKLAASTQPVHIARKRLLLYVTSRHLEVTLVDRYAVITVTDIKRSQLLSRKRRLFQTLTEDYRFQTTTVSVLNMVADHQFRILKTHKSLGLGFTSKL